MWISPGVCNKSPCDGESDILGNDFPRDFKARSMAGESARGNDLWSAEAAEILCVFCLLLWFFNVRQNPKPSKKSVFPGAVYMLASVRSCATIF